jgi:hypothetical protein
MIKQEKRVTKNNGLSPFDLKLVFQSRFLIVWSLEEGVFIS